MKTTKIKQLKLPGYIKLLLSFYLATSCIAGNAQTFEWVNGMGGNHYDIGYGVATDKSGNVYVVGYFGSALADFNGKVLISYGGLADVFLAKYDAGGNCLWAHNMGGEGFDVGYGIAVDDSGGVYITGTLGDWQVVNDTAYFDPNGSSSGKILVGANFFAKYDTAGNFIWIKRIPFPVDCRNLAVDGRNNVYMTGTYRGTTDLNPGGTGGILTNQGGYDAFLAKYDAAGNFLRATGMGGSGADGIGRPAVDRDGNMYLQVNSNSPVIDFNSGGNGGKVIIPPPNGWSGIAKYSANGDFIWVKQMAKGIPGNLSPNIWDLAVGGSGDLYVTGVFTQYGDFNPGGSGGKLTAVGPSGIYVAKYDAAGNYLWVKNVIGESSYARCIAVDGSDNVYVGGLAYADTLDFNPGGSGGRIVTTGSRYNGNLFIAKYGANGNYFWSRNMGSSSGNRYDTGEEYGLAVDNSGNVYATGDFQETTFDFNPGGSGGVLTSAGLQDVYLVKFSCSDTSSSYLAESILCGESYTLKDSVYRTAGTYTQAFRNASGCDSTITLDLTILPMEQPVIRVDSFTLSVPGIYDTYQWLLNGKSIAGANDSAYTVKENGNYQVIVTKGHDCSATAAVYTVTNYTLTGIEPIHALAGQIRVYPNPVTDVVYIQSPVKVHVRVTDIAGKLIKEQADAVSVSMDALAEGMYLLNIADEKGVLLKVEKVVKTE